MSELTAHRHGHSSTHAPAHPSVLGLVANFIALMLLLVATVAIADVDLGRGNFVAAIAIAATKMTLIMLFFMNLRYSKPLSRLVACAGFLWLLILFALAFSDYFTRGWLKSGGGNAASSNLACSAVSATTRSIS